MRCVSSFLFEAEALSYIEKHRLDAIIDRNIFTGKYDVLDMS